MSQPDRHVELDDLALLALGEPIVGADHIGDCSRCAAELDQIAAIVTTARAVTNDDMPLPPRPEVWERIRTEIAPPPPTKTRARRSSESQRRWSWLLSPAALAGAAAAVVGVGVIAMPQQSSPTVLAATPMAALDDRGVSGAADVVSDGSTRSLQVQVSNLVAQDGAFYEVWLIAPDASRMVSLGVVADSGGALSIPGGLDLAAYPLVDISLEPMDGDPLHSKVSISRGDLAA